MRLKVIFPTCLSSETAHFYFGNWNSDFGLWVEVDLGWCLSSCRWASGLVLGLCSHRNSFSNSNCDLEDLCWFHPVGGVFRARLRRFCHLDLSSNSWGFQNWKWIVKWRRHVENWFWEYWAFHNFGRPIPVRNLAATIDPLLCSCWILRLSPLN